MTSLFIKNVCRVLAVVSFATSAFAGGASDFTSKQKLVVLSSLISTDRVSEEDQVHLERLIDGRPGDGMKYSINSFECSYIGRSFRFGCEMRLGIATSDEKTDIVKVEISGFGGGKPEVVRAVFTSLLE